jgi:hypothetical protein
VLLSLLEIAIISPDHVFRAKSNELLRRKTFNEKNVSPRHRHTELFDSFASNKCKLSLFILSFSPMFSSLEEVAMAMFQLILIFAFC